MSNNLNKKDTTDNVRRELLKGLATIPILGIFILNVFAKMEKRQIKKIKHHGRFRPRKRSSVCHI